MTGKEISRWADDAMFESESMAVDAKEKPPEVFFLQGTPDPLGSIAAFSAMYSGKVVRDKADITDEERLHHLEEMKKTALKAPLEAVNLHWMIEGVHRGITHQVVRQRTAVFAQESLRFAVVDDVSTKVALPPSLAGTHEPSPVDLAKYRVDPDGFSTHEKSQRQRWRTAWDDLMLNIDETYNYLVNDGMPQEDARGALPTNIMTRMNYATNLRNFQDHAGMRLCTQAQFEWRGIWANFIKAMREYCTGSDCFDAARGFNGHAGCDNWQWKAIADLFRPVCYLTGKCEFGADVDRKCDIRKRVQANASIGRKSQEWSEAYGDLDAMPGHLAESVVYEPFEDGGNKPVFIGPIHPAEWLLNPEAAR